MLEKQMNILWTIVAILAGVLAVTAYTSVGLVQDVMSLTESMDNVTESLMNIVRAVYKQ